MLLYNHSEGEIKKRKPPHKAKIWVAPENSQKGITTMSNNTTSVRFTLNFSAKTIVGTKASFDKASKGFGPVYEELSALMAKHPTYGVEIKEPKKPAKDKRTYAGMDIAFMRDFLTANDDSITLKTLNDVIAFAKNAGKSVYPLAKRVLFETYNCFDYADAKRIVDEYRYQRTKELADAQALALALALTKKATAEGSKTTAPEAA